MKLKKLIFLILIVALSKSASAQQNPLFNTYSQDPFQLNIAYAGAGCTQIIVHDRTQWLGLKDSPRTLQLNAHSALGKSNGLGFRFNSHTQGLLNSMQATLGYAYRFNINQTTKVHLGLGFGWMQTALNAQKATVIDINDATLGNGAKQTANGFDSEFGAMLLGEKLKAGISVFHLYSSDAQLSGNNSYNLLPQLNTNVSYIFNQGKKVEIEPWLLNRYTVKGNNVVEGIVNVNFIKTITVGAGYRSNYGIIALLAANVGKLRLAYSFDYGTTSNATSMGSSHQFMLGLNLCKKKNALPEELTDAAEVNTPTTALVAVPVVEEPEQKTEPVIAVTPSPAAAPQESVVTKPEEKMVAIVPDESPKTEVPEQKIASTKTVTPVKIEDPKKPEPKSEKTTPKDLKSILDQINALAEEVIFDLNSAELQSSSLEKIDEIALLMKENPELIVNIVGHTCDKGTEEFNLALSKKRSIYVTQQLVMRSVKSKNIKENIGIGSNEALFDNTSDSQRKNRTIRFEFAK